MAGALPLSWDRKESFETTQDYSLAAAGRPRHAMAETQPEQAASGKIEKWAHEKTGKLWFWDARGENVSNTRPEKEKFLFTCTTGKK